MVYLPTSYLYANKSQIPLSHFIESLREEIYVQDFSSIDFAKHRCSVAPTDIKRPSSLIVNIMNPVMRTWETYMRPAWLHRQANIAVRDLMRREDENTSYTDLAPVNKALQMAAIYLAKGRTVLVLQDTAKRCPYISGKAMKE